MAPASSSDNAWRRIRRYLAVTECPNLNGTTRVSTIGSFESALKAGRTVAVVPRPGIRVRAKGGPGAFDRSAADRLVIHGDAVRLSPGSETQVRLRTSRLTGRFVRSDDEAFLTWIRRDFRWGICR